MTASLACPGCRDAEQDPLTGSYGANCLHCGARALAQGPEYHASVIAGTMTPAYAAALRRIFGPDVGVREAAHRSVREWDKAISAARVAKACLDNPPFSSGAK